MVTRNKSVITLPSTLPCDPPKGTLFLTWDSEEEVIYLHQYAGNEWWNETIILPTIPGGTLRSTNSINETLNTPHAQTIQLQTTTNRRTSHDRTH